MAEACLNQIRPTPGDHIRTCGTPARWVWRIPEPYTVFKRPLCDACVVSLIREMQERKRNAKRELEKAETYLEGLLNVAPAPRPFDAGD